MDKHHPHPVKAYKNDAFIDGSHGRPMRILSEYLEPEARFEKFQVRDTIVFFGSARILSREAALAGLEEAKAGKDDIAGAESRLHMSRYYEDARVLSGRLTDWSKNLAGSDRRFVVCTGGGPGIMEAAS
ncbi:MAG: lysine decarboxylase, partial [Alphaproteobacteria bacterium]